MSMWGPGDDERVYMECDTCCWGVSGDVLRVGDKADDHVYQNPGHRVRISEEGEGS